LWQLSLTQNTNDMIDLGHIIISSGVIQGLLLIIPKNLEPSENYEKWLNNDGFTYNPEKFGNKKFLIDLLDTLKSEFREAINNKDELVDEEGNPISLSTAEKWITMKKIQIEKVRLMIHHDVAYGTNLHTPTGVKYIVYRAYWIDNNGKKFRKFAKNIGAEDKILVNGKVPKYKVDEVEAEIDRMMLEQYRLEYPK
jgi:hypothetical protein